MSYHPQRRKDPSRQMEMCLAANRQNKERVAGKKHDSPLQQKAYAKYRDYAREHGLHVPHFNDFLKKEYLDEDIMFVILSEHDFDTWRIVLGY